MAGTAAPWERGSRKQDRAEGTRLHECPSGRALRNTGLAENKVSFVTCLLPPGVRAVGTSFTGVKYLPNTAEGKTPTQWHGAFSHKLSGLHAREMQRVSGRQRADLRVLMDVLCPETRTPAYGRQVCGHALHYPGHSPVNPKSLEQLHKATHGAPSAALRVTGPRRGRGFEN